MNINTDTQTSHDSSGAQSQKNYVEVDPVALFEGEGAVNAGTGEPAPGQGYNDPGLERFDPAGDDPMSQQRQQNIKSPDDLIKDWQSRHDRLQAEHDQVKQKFNSYEGFMNNFENDPEFRRAVIHKFEPDLLKPKDPLTFVKEGLAKEFGDFKPNPDAEVGSDEYLKSQLYQSRMNELHKEATSQKVIPKTLEEVLQAREDAKNAQIQEVNALKEKVMAERKWTEDTWKGFTKWAKSLTADYLAKRYDAALQQQKGRRTQMPNLATAPGGTSPNMDGQDQFNLDQFFKVR